MTSIASSATAVPRRRRPLTALTLGVAGLLLVTACSAGGSEEGASSSAGEGASSSTAPEQSSAATEGAGQGDPAALEGVSLTVAEDGTPSVDVGGGVETDQTTTRVLDAGEEPTLDHGSIARLHFLTADPTTGDVQAESFTQDPQTVILDDQLKQANPEMYELLTGVGVGGQIAAYVPSQEIPAPAAPSASEGASASTTNVPAQLFVYSVAERLPTVAQGEEVAERDERLPEVTVQDDRPVIATPEGEAPEALVVQPLIQGEGREVTVEDTVTVHYTGVTWSDGSTFDSSWERGAPTTFPLSGVIAGWSEGLEGQKVGSRVLISIPSEQAYGEQGTPTGDLKNEDLLFVVDILDAQAPAPQN